MISCVRRLQFCAGHRVWRHESKCAHLHGHNYGVEIHATAPNLDDLGRVIDFSVLKEKVGTWIDRHWDHGFLYHEQDDETAAALRGVANQKKFPLPYNPTAENIARYLRDEVCPKLLEAQGITVYRVVVHETPNCFAEATLDE